MKNLADITLNQLADQRHAADEAARERSELDVVSVYLVVASKIEAGLIDEARAIVAAYRAQRVAA